MITKILIVTLLTNAIWVILDKYGVISRIQMNAPTRFIRNWSMCAFCVFNSLAVPVAIPVILFYGFSWPDIFLSVMAASLKQMLT